MSAHVAATITRFRPSASDSDPANGAISATANVVTVMHHPGSELEAIALADLGQEPFIMFPRSVGTGLFDTIVTACRDAGFAPRVVQEAPQFTSIIGLVSAGLGVALIPSALAQIRLDGVIYRPLLGVQVSAPVLLVARRRDSSAAVAGFVKMARAAGAPADLRSQVTR